MKNEKDTSLRYRIFNAVFLVSIFLSFYSSLVNYIIDLGTRVILITFFCGVAAIGLYIVFRNSKNYKMVSFIAVILSCFIIFPAMWFANGGSYGSVPYFMIINAGIIALLLVGWPRKIIFSLFVLVSSVLIFIEYRRPELVVGYDSQFIRYMDLFLGFFICLLSIVVLIAFLIDSYLSELQKSKQYLAELEEKNKEIEAKNRMLEKSNTELIEAKEKAEKLNQLLYEEKQKLQKLSITDYLTGTFNKRFITTCLEEEIEESRKKHNKLTLALIDIDNFKNINDTYGHLYGDYVVERVARTIINNLRQTDIVGRYGGDEFLIILPNTSREKGYAMIELIRQRILELEWENDLVVTISGGVIEVGSDELTGLLNKADRLLYKAKNKSRNLIEKEVGG
ncbi:MAG: diguanylate cyclase [Clostridia bacterium]|nr:diguanylate cyclase [Clostridia bacterium]